MSEFVRTIVLKIYNPSKEKSDIIDEAILNYTKAYQYILDMTKQDIEAIKEECKDSRGKYNSNYIVKWINKKIDKELNKFSIEPFKDSIKIDFSAMFTQYLSNDAKNDFTKFPSVYIDEETLEAEYSKLINGYDEENKILNEEYRKVSLIEDKINKLLNKFEKHRAIFFCRYSTKRNYSLLYNSEKDKYYAKIYLMNIKNDKRKAGNVNNSSILRYIDKNNEIFKERASKRCYLIFPLSFGKWQEKYLKEALKNPEILKTARLVKRNNEYFLSINIVKDEVEEIKTVNYIGVSRSFSHAVNYSIVNEKGESITSGFKKIEGDNIADNKIHEIANSLVDIAYENKCQFIMERIVDIGDGLKWQDKDGKNYVPVLDYLSYNKLFNIIKYKAVHRGLPNVIRVSAVNIFYTCPYCNKISRANRFSGKLLICTFCGKTIDVELAGSLNLARKIVKYNKDSIKIKVENTREGLKFTNKELGFEFYPQNPYDCLNEFMEQIDITIKDFYDNIDMESKNIGFKKKYSMIKKIENNKNIFEIIN